MMKRAVRAALYKLGYELSRIPADGPTTPGYSDVRPLANYSPWLEDREFLRVYNLIKSNTLVDSYRCWELWKLAHQVSDFGVFLEVGGHRMLARVGWSDYSVRHLLRGSEGWTIRHLL
jgi:hypothetical protein